MRTQEPLQYDAANLELLRKVMLLEREHKTFLGILPATIWERRIIHGLPVLPTLQP